MPSLLQWIPRYILPSVFAVTATYFILRFTQREDLKGKIDSEHPAPTLSSGGKTALTGIGATAVILMIASALNMPLGLSTAITGTITAAVVIVRVKQDPLNIIKGISWAIFPLVAGLFVIVEGINKTGMTQNVTTVLHEAAEQSITLTAWVSGIIIAFSCNLMNNLPAGLLAGSVVRSDTAEMIRSAILIGIDLGPNLSITGSLATLLWLTALRKEGLDISAWAFLKLGALVMTVALIFALGGLWISSL